MPVIAVVALLAAVGPGGAATLMVGGPADTVSVAPGQTFTLEFVVRQAGPAFNAFDLDVRFDPARLTNVPMVPLSDQRGTLMTSACLTNQPFHLFSGGVGVLSCTMVILCAGVTVTGPGQLYRVNFTSAPGDAWTEVTFGPGTAFYLGGPRVDTLVTRPLVIRIGNPPVLGAGGGPGREVGASLDRLVPNPVRAPRRLGVDFRLPRRDSARWMLLDAQGRAVAAAPLGSLEAGVHHVSLELPPLAPGRYLFVLRTGGGESLSRTWAVLR